MKAQYACPVYCFENIKSVENTSLCFTISDQLLLDILLTEIRGKTISYLTYKKKKSTEREISLGKEIQLLEQNLTDSMSDTLIEKQKELENIRKHKLRGQIVRARAKWIEEGEKPSTYFCSLEARNFTSKQIPKIEKENGIVIDKQDKILEELKDFYKYLYTQPESVERHNFHTDLEEYKDINLID